MTDGAEFVKLVTSYLMTHLLNATTFCQLVYWAGKAKIAEAQPFGVRPRSPNGHYQRHLDRKPCTIGKMDRFSVFNMPGHYQRQLSQSMQSTTALPIQEFMAGPWSNQVSSRSSTR